MAGRPTKAPKGFLTTRQVVQRAGKGKIEINLDTLRRRARKGRIPFARRIPGKRRGLMFPEAKLDKVMKAALAPALKGRPPVAAKGFLTPTQVAARAKKQGIEINPKTLSLRAREGKIPFRQPIPGKQKGVMFPESRLGEVIRAAPKKTIMPKGSCSTHGLMKLAKDRGLKIYLTDIQAKIARIEAGEEPRPKGLERDPLDSKHRWILPKQFAKEVLAEVRQKQTGLQKKLQSGQLVPLTKLATDLGFAEMSLHTRKDIKKVRIAGRLFVARGEAARVKRQYENKRGKKPKAERPKKPPRVERRGAPAEKVEQTPARAERRGAPARKTEPTPIESFEKTAVGQIEFFHTLLPGNARRETVGRQISQEINKREQQLRQAKKKLLEEKKDRKITIPSLIEENDLKISTARLEIIKSLFGGEGEKDRGVQFLIKRVKNLQSQNEALRGK